MSHSRKPIITPQIAGDGACLVAAVVTLAVLVSRSALCGEFDVTRHEDWSTDELLAEIVKRADEGHDGTELIHIVEQRGGEAILAATSRLDARRPVRSAALYDVIAHSGMQRRMPEELLRLYDPIAHELFYNKTGQERQEQIAIGLNWDAWPEYLPAAVVRAAPLQTLAWLTEQARATSSREKVIRVLNEWSRWFTTRNERQYRAEFAQTLVALTDGSIDDQRVIVALLEAAAASESGVMLPYAADGLSSDKLPVRIAAIRTLGRLRFEDSLEALLKYSATETQRGPLAELAAELGSFPADGRAGRTSLELFQRVGDAGVRQQILFSAVASNWNTRDDLIEAALASQQGSVIAVALTGIDEEASVAIREQLLAMAAAYQDGPPPLVDALGQMRAAEAVAHLVRWLRIQKNSAVRLKLVLALERIGNKRSHQAIAEIVESEIDEGVLSWAVRAAGRLHVDESLETLAAIAEESESPASVRTEAIWALSYFDDQRSRDTLRRLAADPVKHFAPTASGADNELLRQAQLYVELALLRLGRPGSKDTVTRLFNEGTPVTRMTSLIVLGNLGRDHAVIGQALRSVDFAVLLAAVRAAGQVDPLKYRPDLVALRDSVFVRELAATGLQDVETLTVFLTDAIGAGKESE